MVCTYRAVAPAPVGAKRLRVPQPNCQDRLDRPNQKPSMTLLLSSAAGLVGGAERDEERARSARCAGGPRGRPGPCAGSRAGRRRPGARIASCGPVVELRRRPRAAGASGRPRGLNQRRLWVVKPEPTISVPCVAQRREPAADLEQPPRVERRHRHLEDRDVGVGEHLHQRHVGAVVEPARLVAVHRVAGPACSSFVDLVGELGRGRGVVGDLVVVLREAPEVVDQRAPARWSRGRAGPPPSGRRP